ncbi:MAG: hypothetical protein ACQEVA_13250 [Myxococcota bacterium]
MKNWPLRKMAERNVCSAIFVSCFMSFLVLVGFSTSLAAQSSDGRPSLPSPSELEDVHVTFSGLDPAVLAAALASNEARADTCTVARELSCNDLIWNTNATRVAAHRWTFDDDGSTWHHVTVTRRDAREISAAKWVWKSGVSIAEDVRFESSGESQLRVGKMVLHQDEATGGWRIRLYGLAWQSSDSGSEPSTTRFLASFAMFDGTTWRIEDVRIPGGGPGPWKISGREPSLRPGVLPPRVVHAGGDVTEVEAIAVNPMSGFAGGYAGYMRGTFDDWFGVGLGLVGKHEASERGLEFDHDMPLATVGAIWRPGSRPALVAEGDAIFGEPLTHAAVALETPGYQEAWRTQRIRRGAFFRDWSHSRGGIALHGESHALRASIFEARVFTDSPTGDSVGANAGFGTEYAIDERTELGLEVHHRSVGSGRRDRHVSSIRTDVMIEFGDSERAFARLGGLGRIRTRIVPTEVGFGAGTAGGMYAAADAGMSFTGVFERLRHRVRPSAFVISEVVDFEKTASEAISDGGEPPAAFEVASQSPKPWHSAGIRLEQRLNSGNWSVDVPAEVFAASFGAPSSFTDILGASARLNVSYVTDRGSEVSATGHMVCERACQNVAWDVGARLDIGRWDAAYSVARANRLSQRIADLQAMGDIWSRILAFELPASTLRVSQSATIGWEHRRLRVDVTGVTNHSHWGAALEPKLAFDNLGWSVGLSGFYDSFDGEWGLMAGLSGR